MRSHTTTATAITRFKLSNTRLYLTTLVFLQVLSIALALSSSSSSSSNNKNNNGFPFSWPWSPSPSSQKGATSSTVPNVIEEEQIVLKNGVSAQVLIGRNKNNNKNQRPPLIFLHGSFHAAWCWSEQFMPFFVNELGYPVVVALSWRGTGGTPAGEGVKKVKVSEHCDDLDGFLEALPNIIGNNNNNNKSMKKPILLSHSFGGIVVMKYLENNYFGNNNKNNNNNKESIKPNELFSGIVSMCSVPPSGNGKMTMRFLKKSWLQSWKITTGFAMKKSITDPKLCRELFFGGIADDGDDFGISDDDICRYQGYFKRDTEATIDLLDLAKQLPSNLVDEQGRAPFWKDLPPSLVIGATDDFIVDVEGNVETANYYGLLEEGPVYVNSPHDVMLGRNWKFCANAIHSWIEENDL